MQKILVVTDKYPPSMVGGAELSLHVLLKSMDSDWDIRVAVLEGQTANKTERFDEMEVVGLPSFGNWPPSQHDTLHARGIGPSFITRRFAQKEMQLRFLLDGKNRGFKKRLERLRNLRVVSRDPAMTYLPSMDDDLVANRPTTNALKKLVREYDPDLVHADNYRSILAVANSDLGGIPFTAMVRDHRFFCAQRNQSTNIDGQPCSICEFGCVRSADERSGQVAKKLMSEIRAYRIKSLSKASEIVTTSSYLRKQLEITMPDTSVHAIGNPTDAPARIDQIRTNINRSDPPEILIVGMLNENKGQERVIEWAKELKQQLDDFRIVLAGRGQLSKKITRLAEEHGIRDHLILTGFLDRNAIYRAYSRASVVVAPNRWPEPFGRVPLEAG